MEDTITAAGRKWLVAAHVSHHVLCPEDVLNMNWQHNKAELEGQVYKMSWDWDAKDIDPDEDNGWMWVPITPKTLEDEALWIAETKLVVREAEEEMPPIRSEPHQVMTMYAVTNGPGGVRQATTPVHQVIGTPCEGYTTPYNESPFPGVLPATMATTTT